MKEDSELIEKRLQGVKNFYLKTSDLIDNMPDSIPENIKNKVKDAILGDKELKNLMDSIDTNRPPRIFLMGRTGVGKSSLINALCGAYLAKVSDTISCTTKTECYQCKKGDKVMMEIMDTRGINESLSLDDRKTAEETLIEDMKIFSPDVAILVLNATHRDSVNEDVIELKKLADEYKKINSIELPIVVTINKCDDVAPSRFKVPREFPEQKLKNIEEIRTYFKKIIIENHLKVEQVVSISSMIDWKTEDGIEVSMSDIDSLTKIEQNKLQFAFDGRYNIDVLFDALENAIQDNDARMGLRLAARLDEVVRNISKKLCTVFSGISSTVALTPIPASDIYILLIIEMVEVSLIGLLSGREMNFDTAKEFIFSMSGVAGIGYVLKIFAQQSVKLMNVLFPGSGSAVSAGIAGGGTYAIGRTAIAYYIDGKDIKEAKKIFKKLNKEKKN